MVERKMMIFNLRTHLGKIIDMNSKPVGYLQKVCEFYCSHPHYQVMYSDNNGAWHD